MVDGLYFLGISLNINISIFARQQKPVFAMVGGESKEETLIQARPLPETLFEDKRPEVLAAELSEIENSISHLRRSNVALEEALVEDPTDEDFKQALEENAATITKRVELALRYRVLLGLEEPATAAASLVDAAATAAATAAQPQPEPLIEV